MSTPGTRIREQRERLSLSQADLVHSLNCFGLMWSQGTLSRVETGQREVRLTEAVVVSKCLVTSLLWIATGEHRDDYDSFMAGRQDLAHELREHLARIAAP